VAQRVSLDGKRYHELGACCIHVIYHRLLSLGRTVRIGIGGCLYHGVAPLRVRYYGYHVGIVSGWHHRRDISAASDNQRNSSGDDFHFAGSSHLKVVLVCSRAHGHLFDISLLSINLNTCPFWAQNAWPVYMTFGGPRYRGRTTD
jgi:hypothetical protein